MSGFNSETVRYFEKTGLLPPPERTSGGHRRYHDKHLKILRLAAKARGLGFTPQEVRTLVDLGAPETAACDDVRGVATSRLKLIRQKIDDLQMLERLLEETIGRCSGGPLQTAPSST